MKKLMILSLVALGTISLSACSLLDFEKSYSFSDYKSLVAERGLSEDSHGGYTKATQKLTVDGTTVTTEFVWSDSVSKWVEEDDENSAMNNQNIVIDLKTLDITAVLMGGEVDEVFKLYAKKASYRIVGGGTVEETTVELDGVSYNVDGHKYEVELKYDEYGMTTYYKYVNTNTTKKTISSMIEEISYS